MGIRRNQSVCYGKVCEATVCGTDVCEDFIPFMCGNRMRATLISPTCKGVTFVGTEDVSIRQGIGINLLDGVYAYDEDGTELPITVSPETINKCEVGNHEVVYTAIGAYLSRDKRNVTITQIDPPTISGMDTAHISVDTDFNPANGVSAVDDNGNTVPFEYSGEYYRDASGAIASFETLKQTSAVSVLTTIEPIQSGSGTPSPDNVRPISGHTECITYVSPTTSETDAETYTTDLGRTVYGGTLDVVSGVLTVDRAMVDMGTLTWGKYSGSYPNLFVATDASIKKTGGGTILGNAICSQYAICTETQIGGSGYTDGYFAISGTNSRVYVNDTRYTSASDFKTAVNGAMLCYELSTPQTYQLTPTEVELLLGTNNLWTDCGSVNVTWEDNIPTSGAYQYPIKGTYQITYTAEDECGNETEVTKTIVVGD